MNTVVTFFSAKLLDFEDRSEYAQPDSHGRERLVEHNQRGEMHAACDGS